MGDTELKDLFEKVDNNKSIIAEHKPFDPNILKDLQQYYRLSLTYSSNALEGNTLT